MDAFISYRRESGAFLADWLNKALRAARCTSFYDKENIEGGKFPEQIQKAICRSNNLILICTENSMDRCQNADDWVRQEIELALKNNKNGGHINIVPVLVRGFEVPKDLPSTIKDAFDYEAACIEPLDYEASFKKIVSLLKDSSSHPLSLAERLQHSNTLYEEGGMSEEERERIVKDHRLVKAQEKEIFDEFLSGRKDLVAFDPAVYEIHSSLDTLNHPEIKKIIGFSYSPQEAEQANKEFGHGGLNRFFCANMENRDFSSQMDQALADSGATGFDVVNLTLILKDSKNPFKKLESIVAHLNKNGIIYVRELDDGLTLSYPDESGLFKKLIQLLSEDKYAGSRTAGRMIYTYLKRTGADVIKTERRFISTSGMRPKERKLLFDTYFSYLVPEYERLFQEEPDNQMYKENLKWLQENYDKAEQAFLDESFFFICGFMFFYGIYAD